MQTPPDHRSYCQGNQEAGQATVAELLIWATTALRQVSPTARLDAELVLAFVLAWPRVRVLSERQHIPSPDQQQHFHELIARRAEREPVAYLIGEREFYGLSFFVDRRVLVPRPETELLVDTAIRWARGQPGPLRVADICTGSGCIAIAITAQLQGRLAARTIATDLSTDALAVAQINCQRHGLTQQIDLRQGDLLAPLNGQVVDLLVSNPPYTLLDQIDEGVRRHEPHMALDGGPDGLDFYRRLLSSAPAHLAPYGILLLEIGADQGQAVAALAHESFPDATIHIHQDLAGWDRVVAVDTAEQNHGTTEPRNDRTTEPG
ncbi:MAG: peptide chain release factor N(5)-glutamine methyltransferase [Roseiflexaceae bacterium]